MATEFRIVTQQHDWTFDTNGNRLGQWTITFETLSGVQSQVIVPDDSYHPETVAQLIATEARVIEDVQHLQHGDEQPRHHPTHPHGTHHHAA